MKKLWTFGDTAATQFCWNIIANGEIGCQAPWTDLEKRVMRHSERGDEPLGHMLKLYAGHDLVHLAQILRIRQAIGAPAAS